jgi:AcrR family transcriptional regulator
MTREVLESTARELFERRGFSAVSAEEIVAAAKVTRGALYHHYEGKEGLFEAVVEEAMRGLHDKIARAAGTSTDPIDAIKKGLHRFLELSAAPRTQKLLFVDAPAVMGWQRWRAMDQRYGLGLLTAAVKQAIAHGSIRSESTEVVAHLLLSASIEAVMLITNARDKRRVRHEAERALLRLVDALCRPAAGSS